MLTGNAGSPAMTPATSTSQAFIQSTAGTLANPSPLDKGQWGSWGIALPNSSLYTGFNTNEADYNSTNQDVLTKTTWAAVPGKEADDGSKTIIKTTTPSRQTDTYSVYYGVRVANPASTPADTYTAEVVYTATTNEVPVPTITNLSKDSYELGSDTNLDSNNRLPITITGTNLQSNKQYNITSTITNLTDTGLTVTIPTDQTNPDLEPGDYTIHVVTQGGEDTTSFTYTESKIKSSYVDYGEGIGHVQVDYDENMIPITYTGDETTPKWVIADPANTNPNPDLNWYDYPSKKWANAVTLTEEGLSLYKGKPVGTVIDEQYVLGYWVYIPRYAYKVMRKEVRNEAITDTYAISKGGFEIIFETNNDISKTPATDCDNDASEYQECIKQTKGEQYLSYPGNNEQLKGQTAWATHPAFTWKYTQAINGFDKTYELNGFWIGKFETTGSTDKPTVLPNQLHIGQTQNGGVIDYYNTAKSVALDDIYNTYGNEVATTSNKNSHGLLSTKSHMQKSNEWGAITILTSSVFGAGMGTVQINGNSTTRQDSSGNMVYGVTGCGPQASGNGTKYQCGGEIGTQQACCSSDTTRAYNGILGKLSSTTQNVYGIYDMAGGSDEYVMGSYTKDATKSSSMHFDGQTQPPYVDLYPNPPFMDQRDGDSHYNIDRCTWTLCGGHAIHETNNDQNYLHGMYDAWNDEYSMFPTYEPQYGQDTSWLMRGGSSTLASGSGLYSTSGNNGNTYWYSSFRITLILI